MACSAYHPASDNILLNRERISSKSTLRHGVATASANAAVLCADMIEPLELLRRASAVGRPLNPGAPVRRPSAPPPLGGFSTFGEVHNEPGCEEVLRQLACP
jgi:hypothetical protein